MSYERKERKERPRVEKALVVPFGEKDEAKALGAVFVPEAKCWAMPEGADVSAFERWLPSPVASFRGTGETPEAAFADALREFGIDESEPIMDGRFHRGKVDGDRGAEKSASYVYIEAPDGPGWYMKNHRTGEAMTGKWREGPARDEDVERRRAMRLQSSIDAERRAEAREREFAAAAAEARSRFESLSTTRPEGTYLDRKGVDAVGSDVRFDGRDVVLAYRTIDGEISTLQTIPAREGGAKLYMKGGRKEGAFVGLGAFEDGAPIVVCEGYATGATLRRLSGEAVAVAGDAGSLLRVCSDLRNRYPGSMIAVAPDDDRLAQAAGKPNRGMEAGCEAARAVGGVLLRPPFDAEMPGTDWNDLEREVGTCAARAFLESVYDGETRDLLAYAEDCLTERTGYKVGGRAEPGTVGRVMDRGPGWLALETAPGEALVVPQSWFDGPRPPLGAEIELTDGPDRGLGWGPAPGAVSQTRELIKLCGRSDARIEDVRALLFAGADPSAAGDRGRTALHESARRASPGIVRLLIDAGADMEARDERGATPLHWAAFSGRTESARVLISAGADVDAMDRFGASPDRSARLGEHPETERLVIEAREARAVPECSAAEYRAARRGAKVA